MFSFKKGWLGLAMALFLCSFALGTLKKGDKFIPFSLQGVDDRTVTVTMEDGKLVLIWEYTEQGKNVIRKTFPDSILIDFWATWCVPCRAAMPSMQKLYDKYLPEAGQEKGGLGLFGIAIDKKGAKIVKPFYARLKFTYPMLCTSTTASDDEIIIRTTTEMKDQYKVQTIPVVYLIDSDGIIQHVHVGFKKEDFDKLDKLIENMVTR